MKGRPIIGSIIICAFLILLIVAYAPRYEYHKESKQINLKDSLELPSNGWQLIGEIDGCKLYQKCIPVHDKNCQYCECNLIRWSICEDNRNSALK